MTPSTTRSISLFGGMLGEMYFESVKNRRSLTNAISEFGRQMDAITDRQNKVILSVVETYSSL